MSNNQALISIQNLSKQYAKASDYSLRDFSLNISPGEKFGIFGPNGAGKTTLISILCGGLQPTEGDFNFHLNNTKSVSESIGLVPQELALYLELTALQNLEYFGALCKMTALEIQSRSTELLSLLGLEKVADKKVNTYSGGMKRRLNLAIGIIHNPAILFLDEPTVGVDIQSKNAILTFLNKLNNAGTTIIYTSHHLAEAEELCDRIAILDHGKLIASNALDKLLLEHQANNLTEVVLKLTGEEYRDNV